MAPLLRRTTLYFWPGCALTCWCHCLSRVLRSLRERSDVKTDSNDGKTVKISRTEEPKEKKKHIWYYFLVVMAIMCTSTQSHRWQSQEKNPTTQTRQPDTEKDFSTLGTLVDKVLNCTYSIAVIKLWRIQVADFQAEISFTRPYWVSAGACVSQFYGPFSSLRGFKVPCTVNSSLF